MLKKTIKYKDLEENDVTGDFWFHLSKADIAGLSLGAEKDGGLDILLRKIISTKDGGKLKDMFEDLIMLSYGEKAPDGIAFIKDDEAKRRFRYSDAYSELFIELATDAAKMAEFVVGVVPASMRESVSATNEAAMAEIDAGKLPTILTDPVAQPVKPVSTSTSDEGKDNRPAWEIEDRDPNQDEIKKMSPEEMQRAFARRFGAKQAEAS